MPNAKKGKDNACFVDRTGQIYPTNENYDVEIIDCLGSQNNTIRFNDERGTIIFNVAFKEIQNGSVSNPYHPSVYGIGYFGIGRHVSKINGKQTHSYEVWKGVLRRCYNEQKLIELPTYRGCSICEEWKCFQVFADWFELNYVEGYDLDKDLKIKGNKIYSPSTCLFVPHRINSLILNCGKVRGNCPIGVSKLGNRFVSKKVNGVKSKRFSTPEEAFNHYKIHKEIQIKQVADEWKNLIDPEAYNALYRWVIEITD